MKKRFPSRIVAAGGLQFCNLRAPKSQNLNRPEVTMPVMCFIYCYCFNWSTTSTNCLARISLLFTLNISFFILWLFDQLISYFIFYYESYSKYLFVYFSTSDVCALYSYRYRCDHTLHVIRFVQRQRSLCFEITDGCICKSIFVDYKAMNLFFCVFLLLLLCFLFLSRVKSMIMVNRCTPV